MSAGQVAFGDETVTTLERDLSSEVDAGDRKVLPGFTRSRQDGPGILPVERNTMQKVINCPCGFIVKGDTDDELVARAQAHAKQVHQQEMSREQALAMAKPT